MCGRFVMEVEAAVAVEPFDVVEGFDGGEPTFSRPRYNICPTQCVPTVRAGVEGREAAPMRWGFLPH